MNYKPTLVSDTSDMVHEIEAQTKAILVELKEDGKIVFYVDGQKRWKNRKDGTGYSD